MIRVSAHTFGKHDPSSRFRVRQFIEPLARLGIEVAEHYPPLSHYRLARFPPLRLLARLPAVIASRQSDVVWLRREMVSRRPTLERLTGRTRLFDVDDAIWLTDPRPFSERIVEHCYGVIAGNRYIAEHYAQRGARVWVVPTSVDTDLWRPGGEKTGEEWTVGWIGTESNIKYLAPLEEALADFLAAHHGSQLLIVSDRRPVLRRLPSARWRFARWSAAREVELLREMDVGLMPLDDTEWARGKCAFKMLSYMAVGLPVIVSPVGVNREILEKDELGLAAVTSADWFGALRQLYENRAAARRMGERGRRIVEAEFSVRRNVHQLAEIFREAARKG